VVKFFLYLMGWRVTVYLPEGVCDAEPLRGLQPANGRPRKPLPAPLESWGRGCEVANPAGGRADRQPHLCNNLILLTIQSSESHTPRFTKGHGKKALNTYLVLSRGAIRDGEISRGVCVCVHL